MQKCCAITLHHRVLWSLPEDGRIHVARDGMTLNIDLSGRQQKLKPLSARRKSLFLSIPLTYDATLAMREWIHSTQALLNG